MIDLKRIQTQFDLVGAGYKAPVFIASWREPTKDGPEVQVALTAHGDRWYLLQSQDGSGMFWGSFQAALHPRFMVCKEI